MTFTSGVRIDVRREPEGLWASCPECPGWTAAASTWDELFRLIVESHDLLPVEKRHGWYAFEPFDTYAVAS